MRGQGRAQKEGRKTEAFLHFGAKALEDKASRLNLTPGL